MTIKDIAQLSGCGVATVSRVLNRHPDVSEKMRRRVLAVVEERGFQLNSNAKHLKQQVGAGVAILVKGTQNMLFAAMVECAQALIQERGQAAVVYYLDEESDEVAYADQLCRERKPLGILFLGGDLACFRARFGQISVPCVLLTNSARELGFDNLSSLTTDDEEAAAQVVDYLARRGHQCIGVLGGNDGSTQISVLRLRGCRAGFHRWGLSFDKATQWARCRYALADAYEATRWLLARNPHLTAIFAMSDVMAVGAIRALADLGKCVPGDISVVGFDGVPLANYCVPRLTTVEQDARRLAEQGVEILIERLQRDLPPTHGLVSFHLVEGESVGPPAKGAGETQRAGSKS